MSQEFGRLIRQYRDQNKFSQSRLKGELDKQGYQVTESAISKWEKGIRIPKAEIVEVLEDILMPGSVGILLRASGYRTEAEVRFRSDVIQKVEVDPSHLMKLQTTALVIASNLEKIHNAPPKSLGDLLGRTWQFTVEKIAYGGGWIYGDIHGKLGDVDVVLALQLLQILKEQGGFPELLQIDDWAKLKEDDNTEEFIQRLISWAHRR